MKSKTIFFLFTLTFACFISCQEPTELQKLFENEINDLEVTFNQPKVVVDAKENFEITLEKNWKRELYLDEAESRIYTADTTKSLKESFILDITSIEGKIKLDNNFANQLKNQIRNIPQAYIVVDDFITVNKLPAYCIYSFQKSEPLNQFNIQLYIADKDRYYLLESKIYGDDNIQEKIAKSLLSFETFKIK